MKLLNFV